MELDDLAVRQPRLKFARLAERDHEAERIDGGEARQVPPADEALVLPPPCRSLIGRVGHDAGRPTLQHRKVGNRARLARSQHELPAHIFPGVVLIRRSGANIDQRRGHLAGQTVLRETQRDGVPTREASVPHDSPILIFEFPQFREVDLPFGARHLRTVEGLAVGDERHAADIVKAVVLQPAHNVRGRRIKLIARPHPVMHGDAV